MKTTGLTEAVMAQINDARAILGAVDLVACEDTRTTGGLLTRLGLRRDLISYHDHNELEAAEHIATQIAAGKSVALVSDAGTPLLSDPGYRLVHAAVAANIPVVPIPGASAALSALAAAGLATLDTSPAFAKANVGRDIEAYYTMMHFTGRGAALAAGEIARAGADKADPLIRYVVDDETGDIAHKEKNFADRVMFWKTGDAANPSDAQNAAAGDNVPAPIDAAAEAERVKAMAAATDNVGLFFGEDIFIAIGSILLMKGFMAQNGIELSPFELSVWAIPTAIAAFAIHGFRIWRMGRAQR